jgi:glutamyl/glutaminyl-tRNA synthetase
MSVVNDFPDWADFFFTEELKIDPAAAEKHLSRDLSREFKLLLERLKALKSFDIVSIEESFRSLVAELGIEAKVLIHPLRVALTGKTVGPGLFEAMYYLGLERISKRLERFIK